MRLPAVKYPHLFPAVAYEIVNAVAARHGIRAVHIVAADGTPRARIPRVVAARDEAAAALYWSPAGYSSPEVGALLGGRDHATVLQAIERHKTRIAGNRTALAVVA